ncbi:ABC transporter ATP-binding protein [Algivirga pacifica]
MEVVTQALRGINLSVEEGEFVSIMGPSGCGKSTLLNLLGLLDTPSEGALFFMGKDCSSISARKRAYYRRAYIGFVFQSFNLIEELTLFENIELPLLYQRIAPKERKERVMQVLERLQLLHKKDFYPGQVSGGQQQRAAVARAVVSRPRLILADEPTGNLDSGQGQEVMELLMQLNELGTTIIMATHSKSAANYSHRVIHLFDGEIVTENLIQKG